MGRAPLVPATLWLATGILLALTRPVPLGGGPLLVAAIAGCATALVLLTAPAGGRGARPVRLLPLLLLAAGCLLGSAARLGHERSCAALLPPDLPLEFAAVVETARGDRARLRVDAIAIAARPVPCGQVLSARLGRGSGPVSAGERVRGAGRWWTPPDASAGVAARGVLLVDSIRVAPDTPDEDTTLPGAPRIERMRSAVRERVDSTFPEHAALVASLLLAQRDGLDADTRDRFARAGLSHLLAISGLHVGLVAGILMLLAGVLRLGRRRGALLGAAGTVAYVAFLGAPDSAARAALQIVLVLAARALQRPTRTEAVIAAAAVALLAVRPESLLAPGFQLSFAGVIGILALRPPLLAALEPLTRLRMGRARAGAWLADGLATSAAATLATAPIVAWHFGRLAPVGILANLVAIPLLAAAIPALALAVAAGGVWLPAGRFLADGAGTLLTLLDRAATIAAGLPGATVTLHGPQAALVTVAVAAGFVTTRRIGQVRRRIRALVWTGVAGVVLVVAPLRPAGEAIEVHMIDVGQGDAIAIRTPANRWLLVDAGVAGPGWDAGERLVVPYLLRHGVRRLEGLVLTHADADHTGGAPAVIRAFRPRWIGDPALAAPKAGYLELLRSAAERGGRWVALQADVEIELDGVTVAVLYPPPGGVHVEDANDASVVLRVEYGDFSALLTGDAPAAVEERLVRRHGARLEAEVLKVGHHGSATSTTPELLEATGARIALVSAGRGNRYGHPHRGVLARLEARGLHVLRTDRAGSVVVRADRNGRIELESERGEPEERGEEQ